MGVEDIARGSQGKGGDLIKGRLGAQPGNNQAEVKRAFQDLNRKFEEEEAARKARNWQLPYFNLISFPIRQKDLALVSEDAARKAGAVPIASEGNYIKLGIVSPDSPELSDLLQRLKRKNHEVELYVISQSALEEALKQYKKIIVSPRAEKKEVAIETGEQVLERFRDLAKAGAELKKVSITELLGLILGAAVTMRASDIHLEPEKNSLKIRFRVDGVLQEVLIASKETIQKLLSRIKLLAKLKLNITNQPQDGRFSARWDKRFIDLRVSVLPSSYGETVVMRILGLEEKAMQIDQLGFQKSTRETVMAELKKRTGMILTTGPTGAGKTTTLYSFLDHLNLPGVKIITLEDPVEYRLSGVTQTPVNRAAGIKFADALGSVVRQDPDIIMIGEIRDKETANTAVQAGLTGQLVFSTLHTNDAAGAIPRLLDMGIRPANLAPALNALIAQRLVRRICKHCKEVYRPGQEELSRAKKILLEIPDSADVEPPQKLTFYHAQGCPQCHHLGYFGRVGIFEAFAVDDKIKRLVFKQASSMDIKHAAIEKGMITMQQDAVLKALDGITDLAEVWRVTEE